MSAGIEQRNQDATIYVGNIDEKCNDELVWELFIQVGKYGFSSFLPAIPRSDTKRGTACYHGIAGCFC